MCSDVMEEGSGSLPVASFTNIQCDRGSTQVDFGDRVKSDPELREFPSESSLWTLAPYERRIVFPQHPLFSNNDGQLVAAVTALQKIAYFRDSGGSSLIQPQEVHQRRIGLPRNRDRLLSEPSQEITTPKWSLGYGEEVATIWIKIRKRKLFHAQTENGIRLMLAPRSANAKHSSIPGNSQGIRNLPGSPSFLGNLFKMTAEQCSDHRSSELRQGQWKFRAHSVVSLIPKITVRFVHYNDTLFSYHARRIWKRTEGLSVWPRSTTGATNGPSDWSCDLVFSGPTEGWNGCELERSRSLVLPWSKTTLGKYPFLFTININEKQLGWKSSYLPWQQLP
ncbi:hypothetical protein Tco_1419983 [Tanacetum coccineum]